MSRFLIATWDGGGNTPPAFNLGLRLRNRGHRVRMIGWAGMESRAAAAGLDFTVFPTVPRWPDGVVLDDDMTLLMQCLKGPACRADIATAAGEFDADVLVVDCMLRAGFEAARDVGVPTAVLVHIAYQQFVHGWGNDMMETNVSALLAGCGAVLALQPPGFDPPTALPRGHEYVGAVEHPGDGLRLDATGAAALAQRELPWVLLSLGTTTQHGQLDALQLILDGLGDVRVRVLLTVGADIDAGQLQMPSNVTVTGFVPHELVLPHVSAVVTHAGMSTVAMTLAAGLPMVCVPLGRDQGDNAERVVAIGAGLTSRPSDVAGSVARILGEARYREAAERIARGCQPLGRGARATDMVEALAATGRHRDPGGQARTP